jgi:hypothetical protein
MTETRDNRQTEEQTQPKRSYLGGCAFGRLFTRPNPKTSGVDLFWSGSNLGPGLDETMQETIRAAWHDLGMALSRRMPKPQPIEVKGHPELFWLCRLPPKWFEIKPRRGWGYGAELYEVGERPERVKMVRLAPVRPPTER